MAESKNKLDAREDDLKRADADKSENINNIAAAANGADFLQKEKRMREKVRGEASATRGTKKKRFPIGADIVITLLTLALVAGIVFGAYFLLKYFSSDYEERVVEYTVLVDGEIGALLEVGDDVYCEGEDGTAYLGSVTTVPSIGDGESAEMPEQVKITVRVHTKFRKGEGHRADGVRLSVNQSLELRSGSTVYTAEIVELEEK